MTCHDMNFLYDISLYIVMLYIVILLVCSDISLYVIYYNMQYVCDFSMVFHNICDTCDISVITCDLYSISLISYNL